MFLLPTQTQKLFTNVPPARTSNFCTDDRNPQKSLRCRQPSLLTLPAARKKNAKAAKPTRLISQEHSPDFNARICKCVSAHEKLRQFGLPGANAMTEIGCIPKRRPSLHKGAAEQMDSRTSKQLKERETSQANMGAQGTTVCYVGRGH